MSLKGNIEWGPMEDGPELEGQPSGPPRLKLTWPWWKRLLFWFVGIPLTGLWCLVWGILMVPAFVICPPIGLSFWTIAALPMAWLIIKRQEAKKARD